MLAEWTCYPMNMVIIHVSVIEVKIGSGLNCGSIWLHEIVCWMSRETPADLLAEHVSSLLSDRCKTLQIVYWSVYWGWIIFSLCETTLTEFRVLMYDRVSELHPKFASLNAREKFVYSSELWNQRSGEISGKAYDMCK